jgi:hypothetical protein
MTCVVIQTPDLNADDCRNRCSWSKTTFEITVNMHHGARRFLSHGVHGVSGCRWPCWGLWIMQVILKMWLFSVRGKVATAHVVKAYRKSRGAPTYPLIPSVSTKCRWVVKFNPRLLYLWRKNHQYSRSRGLGGPQSWPGHFGEETNFVSLPRFEPRTVHDFTAIQDLVWCRSMGAEFSKFRPMPSYAL